MTHPLAHHPHASRRSPVLATRGVVATSQPLAANVGSRILVQGGTAVDAAIATAAALTVLEPTSNGLGGDAFAIVWAEGALHGVNGSGRAPAAIDVDSLLGEPMPGRGWPSVTVPGAVDAWRCLHERFGRLPMDALLEPAIHYAEAGYPVSPVVAELWRRSVPVFAEIADAADWAPIFAPGGRAPHAGEIWRSTAIARGLRALARNGLRDFYEGEVADAIVEYSNRTGGVLSTADLAEHRTQWVEPIRVGYGGIDVWELPPNGQGIAALIALSVLDRLPRESSDLDPAGWHRGIEAMKLAFHLSDRHVADPDQVDVPVAHLLDAEHSEALSTMVGERARPVSVGDLPTGGTVYLATADADGSMVSFIQSNYSGFGSGVVVPSHGIALQNRGAGFVTESSHPNVVAPGKRPRHTIIPGFLTRDGAPLGPFGVMGGEMQPQGHVQVVRSLIDHDLNPQAALDAPRWRVDRNGRVRLEPDVPGEIVADLRSRGHDVTIADDRLDFGRGQIILRAGSGVYSAGSEPRADGCAVGF